MIPWHASLLKGLRGIVTTHRDYSMSEIKDSMVTFLEVDEREKVSSRWVGSALQRLGFVRGARRSIGNTYSIDPNKVIDLMIRYQLQESEVSEHSEGSECIPEGGSDLVSVAEEVFK